MFITVFDKTNRRNGTSPSAANQRNFQPIILHDVGSTRTEKDSMGEMSVPESALYGASTQRAVLNFPISGYRFSRPFIRALGLIKWAAAQANAILACSTPIVRPHRASRGGSGRGQARRAFPARYFPDRLRHEHEHERERGDREPRCSWRASRSARRSRSIRTITSTWGSRATM